MELNQCFFSGYAVSPLKMINLSGGGYVGEFSIGVNDTAYTTKEGNQVVEHCNFVKIAVFGNYALTISKMIQKGTPVIVSCRLRQNSWEKDGVKRYDTSFIANFVKVLYKKERTDDNTTEFSDKSEGVYMPSDFLPQTTEPMSYDNGIYPVG